MVEEKTSLWKNSINLENLKDELSQLTTEIYDRFSTDLGLEQEV